MQRGVVGQEDHARSLGRTQQGSETLSMASGRRGDPRQNRMCSDSNRHGVVDKHIISTQPGIAETKCQLAGNLRRFVEDCAGKRLFIHSVHQRSFRVTKI